MLSKIIKKIKSSIFANSPSKIDIYLKNGSIPWSNGYNEYKWEQISHTLTNKIILSNFKTNLNIEKFGIGIDERIVEYPWIFSNINNDPTKLLDAGSTFNFKEIIELDVIQKKNLSILTFYPEPNCFHVKCISYVYSDLRDIPFKDELFDEVVCQSTIEHIAMDNSIYGYKPDANDINSQSKNYEYLKAITELLRVLKKNGSLFITFPYGRFENHGFFQQFDDEMTNRILQILSNAGHYDLTFFRYDKDGWKFSIKEECNNLQSYNPHTGIGKGTDGAAHCRGICCIKFYETK